ncbi:MAG: RdgB/HAM1 family non-canonical purine NTP pyrophosphatase [Gammaproteobacteria bacterium]
MNRRPRWVLASGNRGKLREIQAVLAGSGIELVSQGELGVDSPEETGLTFIENALLKARHASNATGLPAIADDSGLSVDALGGAPGIHSARFAGVDADSRSNVRKLLTALKETPNEERGAAFHCCIVLLQRPDDPTPLISQASWRGQITRERRGEDGFGYDPVFFDPALGMTAAELESATKNRVSHRGQALVALKAALDVDARGSRGRE